MNEKQQNLTTYINAWNETAKGAVESALQKCAAEDVQYCDPFTDTTTGLPALAGVMAGVSESFPGIKHELVGTPLVNHDAASYNWLARLANGKEVPGIDYIEFSADGRIQRVMSFTDTTKWQ